MLVPFLTCLQLIDSLEFEKLRVFKFAPFINCVKNKVVFIEKSLFSFSIFFVFTNQQFPVVSISDQGKENVFFNLRTYFFIAIRLLILVNITYGYKRFSFES